MSGYICDCGSNYSHPDQVIACARDNHGVPREDPKDAELTRLRAREAVLVEALEAVLEGRPTTPPPEIMRGGAAWRNWELWQKCRKALATISDDSK